MAAQKYRPKEEAPFYLNERQKACVTHVLAVTKSAV